jgi:hypothetical protein
MGAAVDGLATDLRERTGQVQGSTEGVDARLTVRWSCYGVSVWAGGIGGKFRSRCGSLRRSEDRRGLMKSRGGDVDMRCSPAQLDCTLDVFAAPSAYRFRTDSRVVKVSSAQEPRLHLPNGLEVTHLALASRLESRVSVVLFVGHLS